MKKFDREIDSGYFKDIFQPVFVTHPSPFPHENI